MAAGGAGARCSTRPSTSMADAERATDVNQVMTQLRSTRPSPKQPARASENPKLTPLMEPLLARSQSGSPSLGLRSAYVAIVHDEQSALTSGTA